MSDYVQKVVRVERSQVEKFDELFPQQGSWTWFIRGCLRQALKYHEESADEALETIVESYLSKHSDEEER